MQSIFASLRRPKESMSTRSGSDHQHLPYETHHTDSVCGGTDLSPVDDRQITRINESLCRQMEELQAENVVRSEVAVQLAVKVVALRQRLQRREEELQKIKSSDVSGDVLTREEPSCTGNQNNEHSGKGGVECCEFPTILCSPRLPSQATDEVVSVQESRHDAALSLPLDHMRSQSPGNNTELRSRLSEMEEQSAVWRERVKTALRVSQERERALLSDNIALQQKLQELQETLNEARFNFEAATLRSARQGTRVHRESQTYSANERAECVSDSCDDNAVELSGSNNHLFQRSVHSPSCIMISCESPTEAPLATAEVGIKENAVQVQQLMCALDGSRCSRDCDPPQFPYPPPPLQSKWSDNTPMKMGVHNVQPRPFIIAVHYFSADAWSVKTKLCVVPRMTVSQLKEHCCLTFNERHHVTLNPAELSVSFYHEKAKRQVVLSDDRELHSFAYFQRCEREKVPVLLSLTPVDNLSNLVQTTMNAALAAHSTQTHHQPHQSG